ncbi:MAG TPA: type II toxin-antitoxin system VapC family toxin [Solirubrobacterales bacterium]
MPLLLDAGVWVAAATPRERYHHAAESLVESGQALAALDLTLFEVANVLGARRREPRWARAMCDVIVSRCKKDRLVRVGPDLIERAVDIAAEHDLTVYDAAYVAVAKSNGWTLVSTDITALVSKGLAVAPDAAV